MHERNKRPQPPDAGPESGWYVDQRCTNCDVARQLAPDLIVETGGRSEVVRQPRGADETRRMLAAAFACHTRSIRHPGQPLLPSLDPFPLPVEQAVAPYGPGPLPEAGGEVYVLGQNSTHTAGANAYLLRRPAGNVMLVDTPRWNRALADRYASYGTVTDVLLTHRDHAAHGRRYADHYRARLWIHEGDLDAAPDADRVLRGTEPVELDAGLTVHPLPGHTRGSVLYVADERYCFSGDSFYWSRTTGDIEVADTVTWYSIEELAASLARTVPRLRFEWLLPGHGDRRHLPADEMASRLRSLAHRTGQLRPREVDFTGLRW
ncbi:ferredoxin [Streptomyces sp. HNM0574]|uniref:4Fe-4S domain-containing protein n=1 Tax=Streptomyces sp. HNM0574 TaxID=2714954 RepID=UPI003216291D